LYQPLFLKSRARNVAVVPCTVLVTIDGREETAGCGTGAGFDDDEADDDDADEEDEDDDDDDEEENTLICDEVDGTEPGTKSMPLGSSVISSVETGRPSCSWSS